MTNTKSNNVGAAFDHYTKGLNNDTLISLILGDGNNKPLFDSHSLAVDPFLNGSSILTSEAFKRPDTIIFLPMHKSIDPNIANKIKIHKPTLIFRSYIIENCNIYANSVDKDECIEETILKFKETNWKFFETDDVNSETCMDITNDSKRVYDYFKASFQYCQSYPCRS